MQTMELDEYEVYLINKHREETRIKKEKFERQKNCLNHDWKYDGHSHNKDSYVCTLCGKVEFW